MEAVAGGMDRNLDRRAGVSTVLWDLGRILVQLDGIGSRIARLTPHG